MSSRDLPTSTSFLKEFQERFGLKPSTMYKVLGWSRQRYHAHIKNNATYVITKESLQALVATGVPLSKVMAFVRHYLK